MAGVAQSADPVIVVGPKRPLAIDVAWAQEDPPGGGPCAALIAGVAHLPDDATHVAVLAGDAPAGGLAVEALRRVIDDAAAAVVTDLYGREQPMTAIYAVEPLKAALAESVRCPMREAGQGSGPRPAHPIGHGPVDCASLAVEPGASRRVAQG